jgi:PLP dependent protein
MSISANLASIKSELPEGIKLVAITKTHPPEVIMEAYNAGHRVFGENKVQELVSKYEALPKDIEWHMVGHLQTNKVKYIAPFVSLIHSVDSLKLLKEINKGGDKNSRVVDCLLQLHIAEEETKFGLSANELTELLGSDEFKSFSNVRVVGLMAMATFTDDMEHVRREFKSLAKLFNQVKSEMFKNAPHFNTLSMGMSSDYRVAVEEGSTMIRVGSSIFGERFYGTN